MRAVLPLLIMVSLSASFPIPYFNESWTITNASWRAPFIPKGGDQVAWQLCALYSAIVAILLMNYFILFLLIRCCVDRLLPLPEIRTIS